MGQASASGRLLPTKEPAIGAEREGDSPRRPLGMKTLDTRTLDEECALWDWARTAGVSADRLREALCKSLALEAANQSPPGPRN